MSPNKVPAFEKFRTWIFEIYLPTAEVVPNNCDTFTQYVYSLGVPGAFLREFDPSIRENILYLACARQQHLDRVGPLIQQYLRETKSVDAVQLYSAFAGNWKKSRRSLDEESIENKL